MKRRMSFTALILIAVLFISACSSTPVDQETATGSDGIHSNESKHLIVGMPGDALYLDPHQRDEGITNSINSNIYDPLVAKTAELEIIPALATEWEQIDELTWRFNLREGVTFHNGEAFTADDVVFSLERCQTDGMLEHFTSSIKEVLKVEEYIVDFVTHKPYSVLLNDLANINIVSKAYLAEVGNEYFNLNPVGTGAYKFVEWTQEERIVLEANENYWKGKSEIDRVTFRPISNAATRTAALISGDVDMIMDVPVRDADRVASNNNLRVLDRPSLRLIYLNLDVTRDTTPTIDLPVNPFKDARVVQAINHAVDVDTIIKTIMNNYASPANQLVPKTHIGFVEGIERLSYNPERARELLAEAGYPNGFKVTLDAPNDRYVNDDQVAQAIASQLAQVGIEVELNLMPRTLFFDYIRPGDQSSFIMTGWAEPTGDAGSTYSVLLYTREKREGKGGSNRGHYSNEQFDEYIDLADSTASLEERNQYIQEATKIVMNELPIMPLYYEQDLYGAANYVEFTPRTDKYIYVYDVKLNK